jgi:hypothetical protein
MITQQTKAAAAKSPHQAQVVKSDFGPEGDNVDGARRSHPARRALADSIATMPARERPHRRIWSLLSGSDGSVPVGGM